MTTLDERFRELIAVGASVAANCHPCLEYHVGKAREVGAGSAEITEAIGVGRTVRKGAAASMDKLTTSLGEGAPAAPAAVVAGGCGCSDVASPKPA